MEDFNLTKFYSYIDAHQNAGLPVKIEYNIPNVDCRKAVYFKTVEESKEFTKAVEYYGGTHSLTYEDKPSAYKNGRVEIVKPAVRISTRRNPPKWTYGVSNEKGIINSRFPTERRLDDTEGRASWTERPFGPKETKRRK